MTENELTEPGMDNETNAGAREGGLEVPGPCEAAYSAPRSLSAPGMDNPLLRLAVEKNVSVEALEKLVALQERMQDRLAAQEFADALAAFQEECPPIPKTSKATRTDAPGAQILYTFADLTTIAETVKPYLHKHGLSYTWDSTLDGKTLTVVCWLRHRNGHLISAKFECPAADHSGKKSEIAAHGSALSYARRYSLVQVLGLTATDPDDDAASTEPINEVQAKHLEHLIRESGAERERFLEYLKVPDLGELPANRYLTAVSALEARARRKQ